MENNVNIENTALYTITVYSENQIGLLNQISNIFTRRSLNIWSLSVSASSIEGVHKFTIVTQTTKKKVTEVIQQIEKKIDVVKAFFYTNDEIIYREIALYKVDTEKLLECDDFEAMITRNNAKIIEMNKNFTVIQKTGHCSQTQKLYDELKKFGVRQFVRSGRVSISKGQQELVTEFLNNREKISKNK